MSNLDVLIVGAGIAGPALAHWLVRAGHRVIVIERAPALRVGGQAVDFRGPVHRAVLERMDLWDAIHEQQTNLGDHTLLDVEGNVCVTLPASMMSGDVEILRGDLCRLLYERTRDGAEYVFGTTVTAIEHGRDDVRVTFTDGTTRRFDLVVGADGLRSVVRELAFERAAHRLRFHGYYVAGFILPNLLGLRRAGVTYSVPGGRGVSISSSRFDDARALFVFASESLAFDRGDSAAYTRVVREAFGHVGWETPRLLDAMERADDLYFDAIASADVRSYACGRVGLLGDAAWGGTIGGQGTGLAIVGAYVLAGEIAAAGGDHATAFTRYEERMRAFATRCQSGASRAGAFLAPRTRWGLALRNYSHRALTSRPLIGLFERMVRSAAEDLALPEYAL